MENNTTLSRAEKLDKIFGTPLFAVLLAIFCNVLWGCAFPFIKMGYRLFEIDPSNTASIFCFAGVRFMLGSLLGVLPGLISVTVLGTSVSDPSSPLFIVSVVLIVAFFLLSLAGRAIYNKINARKNKKSEALDEGNTDDGGKVQ